MLLVVAGPSGVGKSYLISELLRQYPEQFGTVQLVTTRPPRSDEQEIDRLSVNPEQFESMRKNGDFVIAGEFRSNWYGFPAILAQQQPKMMVVNTWPALIPQFAEITGVVLIGLTVDPDHIELLRERMLDRGETPESVAERTAQVKVDINTLSEHASLVRSHGTMFNVTGDETIPQQVIPWTLQNSQAK